MVLRTEPRVQCVLGSVSYIPGLKGQLLPSLPSPPLKPGTKAVVAFGYLVGLDADPWLQPLRRSPGQGGAGVGYSRVTRSKHVFSSGLGLTWQVSRVSFTGGRLICGNLRVQDTHVTLWASEYLASFLFNNRESPVPPGEGMRILSRDL